MEKAIDSAVAPGAVVPPAKCPRCDSPAPHLHPAMQFEGEVQPCSDPFHFQDTPENRHPQTGALDANGNVKSALVPPARRWRCPDCGITNAWDALECTRCHLISPPNKEYWEVRDKPVPPARREEPPVRCPYCAKGMPIYMLDDDGTFTHVSGRVGQPSHCSGDAWWPCPEVEAWKRSAVERARAALGTPSSVPPKTTEELELDRNFKALMDYQGDPEDGEVTPPTVPASAPQPLMFDDLPSHVQGFLNGISPSLMNTPKRDNERKPTLTVERAIHLASGDYDDLLRERNALEAEAALAASSSAPPPQDLAAPRVRGHQRMLDTLWELFTLSGPDARKRFGESQLTNDSNRINYALELMAAHVSPETLVASGREVDLP